jgi:hypothetical protein
MGNNYKKYVKSQGRTLVNLLNAQGTPVLVVIPKWWQTRQPTSVFYKLKQTGNIHKFMAEELSRGLTQDELETYTAMGADHCNQKPPPRTVYELEPMDLHELENKMMSEKKI